MPGDTMRRVRRQAGLIALVVALPGAAWADLFSPGELAQSHAPYEGLSNCTLCHVAGEKHSEERCVACHKELAEPLKEERGFHGRIPKDDRGCAKCHHDHRGRSFSMIDWGPGGKKKFDHAKAGWPLKGKHAPADCAKCHERRRVVEPAVLAMLKENPRQQTHLGLPVRCGRCHFDEHRGQLELGAECQRCHDEKAFKPAPLFDHARAHFPLEGKHKKVLCEKCHKKVDDPASREVFPPPVAPAFAKYTQIPFDKCTDCHKDPHDNRLGSDCKRCHSTVGWRVVRDVGKERGFHEKTRYPLRGAHVTVGCEKCHGGAAGTKARFRGLPYATCSACHPDAHLGQLAQVGKGASAPDCGACHTVETFRPARYELTDHEKTRYPLAGAHRAVACSLCHPQEPKLAQRVPRDVQRQLARQKRPELFSLALFDLPKAVERCETCHADPHAGQFAPRVQKEGCVGCHDTASFEQLKFDHDKDSRFALSGKHEKTVCEACHPTEKVGGKPVVRYKPVAVACAACHPDLHAGQLALRPGEATDCARCHTHEAFKKASRFAHQPPFTDYRLEGRHRETACDKCHPAVPVAQGVAVVRYKPLPRACEACHADYHRGAFRGLEP